MSFTNRAKRLGAASAACLMVVSAGAMGVLAAAAVSFTVVGVVLAPVVLEGVTVTAYKAMEPKINQLLNYAETGKWTPKGKDVEASKDEPLPKLGRS